MTHLIQSQLQEIFYMFCCGIAMMFVFLARDGIIARVRNHRRLHIFLYLFFWLAASFLFCEFLYAASYGRISWYSLAAFAMGCILWKKGFCDIINLYETAQKYNGENNDEQKNKRESRSI